MQNLKSFEDYMNMEVPDSFDGEPVPIGDHNVVLTKVEVGNGPKGPYLKIEATIHDEGELKGRKVWRNAVSFSEKALTMPGGLVELMQAAKPEIPADTPATDLPGVLARALTSVPLVIDVDHEQRSDKNGVALFNDDGTPSMRATIGRFLPAQHETAFLTHAEVAACVACVYGYGPTASSNPDDFCSVHAPKEGKQ